jgi:outer membrane protein
MKRFITYSSFVFSLTSLVLIIFLLIGKIGQPKIAYVRSTELVYGYLGMQDAHRTYEEKSNTWKNNTDTLQQKFQRDLDEYKRKGATLSKAEKEKIEQSLTQQKQTIINYMQNVSDQAKKEDEKITQAVLNQVNSFVEEYGKTHGYKMILGTTQEGSLLYGEDGIDITKEILEALNKNYKGEELPTN